VDDFEGFSERTLRFLRGLSENNNKPWFDAHRDDYDEGIVEPAKAFVSALGPRLRKISKTVQFEPRINGSLFRINRDIRFSKDKRPYKDHLDLWFWHGKEKGWEMPGFWFRLTPDELMLGAGMHGFEKATLDRYRNAVLAPKSGARLQKVIAEVTRDGYEIGGATRKKVPRGFDAEHERAPLLLHDGLWASLTTRVPREVKSAALVDMCADRYAKLWPIGKWILDEVAV
jgi:uncharacterized protein (TIGR02453 family)